MSQFQVTNEQYTSEIASRWNVKDVVVGYVTRFTVRSEFMRRYQVESGW